jgi:hypothetical protein
MVSIGLFEWEASVVKKLQNLRVLRELIKWTRIMPQCNKYHLVVIGKRSF